MKAFSRLLGATGVISLLLPQTVFALGGAPQPAQDVILTCCTMTNAASSAVSSCYQFSDAIPAGKTTEEKNVYYSQQNYKCNNIPYLYDAERGKTATAVPNDGSNSGTCGHAASAVCAGVTTHDVHATCDTDNDCGTSSVYACENHFCKIKNGQGCLRSGVAAGGADPAVNCVTGNVCRTTPNGSKCLRPDQELPTAAGGTANASTIGTDNAPFVPVVPQLGVPIPGFEFTPATEIDGVVSVPYLGQYVNAIYRYMTAIVLTVAIVMVVIGGFKYLLAATPMAVKDGKQTITDALIGMGLVLGAYVILNTLNPRLLNLDSLQFERIRSQELQISLQYGGAADDADYAPDEAGGLSTVTAPPGSWRANALAVCGDSNVSGMSLDQRKQRLKMIVQAWTNLASTQRGSIYVRGGSIACTAGSNEYGYKLRMLTGIKNAGYRVNIPEECFSDASRGQTNRASAPANCMTPITTEYQRLVAGPANTNGLICGDCKSYQGSVMSCFGGNTYRSLVHSTAFNTSAGSCDRYLAGTDDVAFIKVHGSTFSDEDVQQFVSRLQFGDIIHWSQNTDVRHTFMYTGGAGLPYEIVEMGGGGNGDSIGGTDGRAAWAKIGLPNFDGSFVKAHRSAVTYLSSTSHAGARCLKAVRIIDN